ncbi:unnamed protein product [Coccothraustes coccothraustes]
MPAPGEAGSPRELDPVRNSHGRAERQSHLGATPLQNPPAAGGAMPFRSLDRGSGAARGGQAVTEGALGACPSWQRGGGSSARGPRCGAGGIAVRVAAALGAEPGQAGTNRSGRKPAALGGVRRGAVPGGRARAAPAASSSSSAPPLRPPPRPPAPLAFSQLPLLAVPPPAPVAMPRRAGRRQEFVACPAAPSVAPRPGCAAVSAFEPLARGWARHQSCGLPHGAAGSFPTAWPHGAVFLVSRRHVRI